MITAIVFVLSVLLVFIKIIFKFSYSVYDGVECLVGKVAVVTGGNKGIGWEVSKYLASRGCKVIIASRSGTEEQRKQLVRCTHNDNIVFMHLDLKSFDSVKKFANQIHKNEEKIDILVNNAGSGFDSGFTKDGLHPVIQCNAVSPLLLTYSLIDLLKKSEDGRIVFSSSIMAFYTHLSVETLTPRTADDNQSINYFFQLYGSTKLAEIIVSNHLSKKLRPFGIKSNCIHPGLVNTNIWDGLDKQQTLFAYTVKLFVGFSIFLFSRTSKEAAQGIVALCIADEYEKFTGQFLWGLGMKNIYPNPKVLKNKQFCDDIWTKMNDLCCLQAEKWLLTE